MENWPCDDLQKAGLMLGFVVLQKTEPEAELKCFTRSMIPRAAEVKKSGSKAGKEGNKYKV